MSTQILTEKWNDLLETDRLEKIADVSKKRLTAQLLENQERFLTEDAANTASIPGGGAVGQNWDPILISMVRRMAPKLIAYDICGTQPMTGPTGLVFAMRARYTNTAGAEAQGLDEANAAFSGKLATGGVAGKQSGDMDTTNDPFSAAFDDGSAGMETDQAELSTNQKWNSMSMTIERASVTAKSRQLRADWSLELTQDLKAIHGVEAETELSNILSTEITNEINREVVRRVYTVAKVGAQYHSKAVADATPGDVKGQFDLQADADGRWSVEKFKGLFFALEREANQIALDTRRGKGNIVICSADVASALVLAGILDYAPAAQAMVNVEVDITGVTYAGNVGRFKIYIDPYLSTNGFVMGYKGSSQYDAGFFYCPYVPLQMVRATNPENFQPAIGFKTRYGLVANPFVIRERGNDPVKTGFGLGKNENQYYRKVQILGL